MSGQNERRETWDTTRIVLCRRYASRPEECLEQLDEQALEGLTDLIRVLVNEAMQIERENFLNAKPYERSKDRRGYADGYKPMTINTRVGKVTFGYPR